MPSAQASGPPTQSGRLDRGGGAQRVVLERLASRLLLGPCRSASGNHLGPKTLPKALLILRVVIAATVWVLLREPPPSQRLRALRRAVLLSSLPMEPGPTVRVGTAAQQVPVLHNCLCHPSQETRPWTTVPRQNPARWSPIARIPLVDLEFRVPWQPHPRTRLPPVSSPDAEPDPAPVQLRDRLRSLSHCPRG